MQRAVGLMDTQTHSATPISICSEADQGYKMIYQSGRVERMEMIHYLNVFNFQATTTFTILFITVLFIKSLSYRIACSINTSPRELIEVQRSNFESNQSYRYLREIPHVYQKNVNVGPNSRQTEFIYKYISCE